MPEHAWPDGSAGSNGGGGGGGKVGTGAANFDSTSAGAFQITLSEAITPVALLYDRQAAESTPGPTANVSAVDVSQLPTSNFNLPDSTFSRNILMRIDSVGAGVVNGTIISNGYVGGDVGKLRVHGFA
jgi:hypothetical protein